MKRSLAILLALAAAVSLCGCGTDSVPAAAVPEPAPSAAAQAPTPTPEPVLTPEPEPTPEPSPAWTEETAAAGGIGAVYKYAFRGDTADVTGEAGDYYSIVFEGEKLFAEKRLVRDASEEPFEEFTGFAKDGAEVYASVYLEGEPSTVMKRNETFTVLDEFDGIMLVKGEACEGYVRSSEVSDKKISSYYSGSDSGSDGGDITLGGAIPQYYAAVLSAEPEAGEEKPLPEKVRILADNTELYCMISEAGQPLMVTGEDENGVIVWSGERQGTFPVWVIAGKTGEEEGPAVCYASAGAKLFSGWRMTGKYKELKINTELKVMYKTDKGVCVEADGETGFISADEISDKKLYVSYSEDSGGGDWTAPVL